MACYDAPNLISEAQITILHVKDETSFWMNTLECKYLDETLFGVVVDECLHTRGIKIRIINIRGVFFLTRVLILLLVILGSIEIWGFEICRFEFYGIWGVDNAQRDKYAFEIFLKSYEWEGMMRGYTFL